MKREADGFRIAPAATIFQMTWPNTITLADAQGSTTATVAPARGALVTSFRVDCRELLYLDRETFLDPAKNVRGGIPVLFPSPGKLADDRWQRGGHAGRMKQHGFARTRAWQVGRTAADSVELHLNSDGETLAEYPWPFAATLRIAVSDARLRLAMSIVNTGSEAMPFALGYHPYFAVADKQRARIDTGARRQLDNVTKQVSDFHGFDLTAGEVDVHLLDHAAQRMPLHLGDGSGIEVSASDAFAHWVVWTVAGKDYVCVEPWTSPGNALNTGDRLLHLAPGGMHESFMDIAFTRP